MVRVPQAIELRRREAVDTALNEIARIRASGTLHKNATHAIFRAGVTFMLIHLKDVMLQAAADGRTIDEKADVFPVGDEKDLTSLIVECRNAACHIPGKLNQMSGGRYYWNIFPMFDDDLAIQFGPDAPRRKA